MTTLEPARQTRPAQRFDREWFGRVADGLAVALAVTLPWSTSATEICAGLLLLVLIPTLDPAELRRVVLSPAGGIPVLLVLLGLVGMAWADVPMGERLSALKSFYKFLFIPLLMVHFAHSPRGRAVAVGLIVSCGVLLVLSWALMLLPGLTWRGSRNDGVPVKDYISQGTLFALCIVILAERALAAWQDGRHKLATAHAALALAFLSNVVLVLDSRTPLAIIPPLLLFLAIKRMRGRWLLASLALVVVSAGVVGLAVPRVRDNIVGIVHEVQDYRSAHRPSRVGERLEFWKKSVGFIAEAPVIGHGTGSIESLFRRAAEGQTGVAAMVSSNPHNQFFGVVIQLGLVGGVVLIAFWIAHLWLFRGDGAVAWIGFAVVVQNVIGSLFNSHLFDFTHGWIYVLGVGVAAGVLRGRRGDAPSTARDEPRSAAS